MGYKLLRVTFFVGLFLFGTMIVSCASSKNVSNGTAPVYVTNTKKINILPPSSIEQPVDEMQLLQGKFGDQSFSLLIYIQADETCINLDLFNDFGTDMGSLSYDGVTASFNSAVFPPALKAEYVLNDLQCAYYKAEDLQKNFESSGLTFVISGAECMADEWEIPNPKIRQIFSGKKLIEEIIIGERKIKIVNYLRGYEYILTSADD